MSKTPIAEIRLPTHHSAINGAKDGHELHLRVKHIPPERPAPFVKGMSDMMEVHKPEGPQPPPLEQKYHVMHIAPATGKGAANDMDEDDVTERADNLPASGGRAPAKRNPIAAIKAKRAAAKGY